MFSAEAYHVIYLLLVTFATIISIDRLNNNRITVSNQNSVPALALAILFSIFIGFRPIDKSFVDMVSYADYYDWLQTSDIQHSWDTDNVIFDNLILACSRGNIGKELFFAIISTIYFLGAYIGIRRILPQHTTIAYLVWLGSFSTFTFSVNGIKAGAAASIFIIAISYYDKKLISLLLAFISLGFHHSMQLPIIAYIISLFIRKETWCFRVWLLCALMAVLHITFFQTLFAGWTDEQGASYLNQVDAEFVKHKGFRIDFVIYSVIPILTGYYAITKLKYKDKLYSILFQLYTISNSVWMLCMYAPFNNRIAYLSWFIYPLVLIYPFIKGRKSNPILASKGVTVVCLNLCFTLFMFFIYNQ